LQKKNRPKRGIFRGGAENGVLAREGPFPLSPPVLYAGLGILPIREKRVRKEREVTERGKGAVEKEKQAAQPKGELQKKETSKGKLKPE